MRPCPTAQSLTYAALDVDTAIRAYAEERRAQVSKRMAAYWLENARPLAAFFKDTKLRHITPAQLAAYQNARTDAGRAPKTINGELSVLRQILKRAKLWYRFSDEYTTLRNRKPPVGRALTPDEQHRLFELARTKPAWLYAYVATHARVLLRPPRLRDQGALLEGHRPDQPPAARAAIEDACRLAIANAEHDLPRGAAASCTIARHSSDSLSRTTSSSRGTAATSVSTRRSR